MATLTRYVDVDVDENEAPKGFYAVPKPSGEHGNICEHCDWRKQCNDKDTDFEDSNNRCMSFPVISTKTGKEIYRKDGQSVIFKSLKNAANQ